MDIFEKNNLKDIIISILKNSNISEINYKSNEKATQFNILFDYIDNSYNSYFPQLVKIINNNNLRQLKIWDNEITIVFHGKIYINW